eukprot:693358-Rhodomonas_salina.1
MVLQQRFVEHGTAPRRTARPNGYHFPFSCALSGTDKRLYRPTTDRPTGASGDVPGEDKKKEKEDEKDEETVRFQAKGWLCYGGHLKRALNPEEWPGPDAERPGGLGGSMVSPRP